MGFDSQILNPPGERPVQAGRLVARLPAIHGIGRRIQVSSAPGRRFGPLFQKQARRFVEQLTKIAKFVRGCRREVTPDSPDDAAHPRE